jgi:hypothetical protein
MSNSHPPSDFKPGVYEHYKAGRYFALHIVRHHETNELFVVYVCPTHQTISIREWATPGKDSWTDELQLPDETRPVQRFRYVGPAL